jgi:type III pantothenate kinase
VDLDSLCATMVAATPGDIAWLASVAPASFLESTEAALVAQGYAVKIVRSLPCCRRLRIAYDEPGHLGVDRFLSLLAASERDDGPWLLVSIGSAVTVDLLADDGRHLGGMIAPSATHMREALGQNFAALDVPAGRATDFADDTADAIATGAQGAVLGLIERSRRLAQVRLGAAPRVILSGGGAEEIASALPFPTEQTAWLVLDGLALFAQSGED